MMPSRTGIVLTKPLKKLEKTIADAERDGRDEHALEVDALGRVGQREQRHLHGDRGEAEADDDDDRADERRRQHLVEPAGAEHLHDAGDDHVDDAGRHEAAEGRRDVAAPRAARRRRPR